MSKETVAIYQQEYLTISMTFIYRQLKGLDEEFKLLVMANRLNNVDIFPWEYIYSQPKTSFKEKAINKLYRLIKSKYAALSNQQYNYYKNVLINENVKLVHAHFGPSGLEILPLVKELNIPLLVTFHGYDASMLLKNRKYVAQLGELFDYAHIITVSKNMKDKLIQYGANPSKIKVHYIGAPLQDFVFHSRKALNEKAKNNELIKFLQVSNFVEKKGHKYTIKAFKEFLKVYPNSRLILAGDGPLRNSIQNLCNELNLNNYVQFVGKVTKPEVIKLMKEADVFLHHSVTAENGDQEGIPTVLMEAMGTGLTVISTYHSGIPELIIDGYNGFLVHEKDIKGYVEKLKHVLNTDNSIRKNAHNYVNKNFNIQIQNEKLADIYRFMINRES
ncbi:glycosyltransferase [Geobacillus stearothermophilus]|uniref:glycosyltransferase n=1 Tax=Geobacillus stearothermophilus TaxID=1422 RepID=UPI003D22081E